MKRREKILFAQKIVELPLEQFSGVITKLIATNQGELAVEVSNQLRKKINSRKIDLDKKNDDYIPKYEQIVNEIEAICDKCEDVIVDTADSLDEIWSDEETERD